MLILLRHGNQKEKEICACALNCLAANKKNRSIIGQRGGIPPLLDLIQNGTISQKEHAMDTFVSLTV